MRAQEAAAGERLEVLKADGGAVANRWLMQFQADVLGAPVVVPEIAETTALGAAYLAGIATGVWDAGAGRGDVARGGPLRAADGRGRARRAARRLAAGASSARGAGRARNRRVRAGVGGDGSGSAGSSAMPDIKPQVYKDPRPAEYFDAVPRALAHAGPDWIYDARRG